MHQLSRSRHEELLEYEKKYRKLLKEHQATLVKLVDWQEKASYFEWQRDEVWKMHIAKPREMIKYTVPRD
jgi:hypothetical protein